MYCPKCEKMLDEDRLAEVSEELKRRFEIHSLDNGKCPVCGTELVRLPRRD